MKKILLSIAMIALVGSGIAGLTGAFYGDTETSTGNTFVAGAVELSIDSVAHYNGMVCTENNGWQPSDNPEAFGDPVGYPVAGSDCDGTWTLRDLDGEKFFNFDDLKPGDYGENTISVHVTSNDAWLAARFVGHENADNGVLDPEFDASPDEDGLDGTWCGELAQNITYTAWVDDGAIDGWQCLGDGAECNADSEEGDNIRQDGEVVIELDELVLSENEAALACANLVDGDTLDTGWILLGQVPGGETHYYGIAWSLPLAVGNEAQTDSIDMDIEFAVEQVRNNPTPFQI